MYKLAGASESAPSFAITGASASFATLVAFSGVDTTTPMDVPIASLPAISASSGSQTAVAGGTITTASANAAVILFGVAVTTGSSTGGTWTDLGWSTATSPGALTELYDLQGTGTTNSATSIGVAWATQTTPSPTGAGTAALSVGMYNGGILLALRPAAAIPQWSGAIATFKPQPASLSGNLALDGTQAGNYTLAGASGAATIAPLPLTVTAVTATKTYDGETTADGTPGLTPALVGTDTTTTLSQAFLTKDAGTNNKVIVPSIVIADGNSGNNYAVTLQNFNTGTILKAAAAITLGNLAHTYDGNPKEASASTTPAGLTVYLTYDGSAVGPSAVGSYAVVASVSDTNYAGSVGGTMVIAVESFAAWQTHHFTPGEITAGTANANVDADGDGLTNFQEYVLGTDPHVFSPPPLVITPAANSNLSLKFFGRGGRKYIVEGSSDLGNLFSWQGLNGYTDIVGRDEDITVILPVDTPKKFYRLSVRVE
jgi:hypothetical protein